MGASVGPQKILFSPLHIKFVSWKFFLALDKDSLASIYLQGLFPKLSEANDNSGVFVGIQVKKEFPRSSLGQKKTAWNNFIARVRSFLESPKDENYDEFVETLVRNFDKMGHKMSIKGHILDLF